MRDLNKDVFGHNVYYFIASVCYFSLKRQVKAMIIEGDYRKRELKP